MPTPEWKPRNTCQAKDLRNAATPAERLLWHFLSGSQLGARFSRQMPVGPYFADFLCRELKLVIELDGFSHDVAPERDAARDRWFRAAGYEVMRFANAEVMGNVEGVVMAICERVAELKSCAVAHPYPLPQAGGEHQRYLLPSRLRKGLS